MKIDCGACSSELEELGALVFTAPDVDGHVSKIHLCVECFDAIFNYFLLQATDGRMY